MTFLKITGKVLNFLLKCVIELFIYAIILVSLITGAGSNRDA